jgi:hypothetical protein
LTEQRRAEIKKRMQQHQEKTGNYPLICVAKRMGKLDELAEVLGIPADELMEYSDSLTAYLRSMGCVPGSVIPVGCVPF